MNILEQGLQHLTESGCSPFFLTSALSSLAFGELSYSRQEKQIGENIQFKERMQRVREDYASERLSDQVAFRKASYERGRQFQIRMMQELNDNRQKEVEFDYFCKNAWPLTIDVRTVLRWQRELPGGRPVPMKVLVAKTDVSSHRKENGCYENFCTALSKADIPELQTELGCWKYKCQSPMAEALNINYVMQGIPTLVLFPYTADGMFYLELATWSFSRGMGAMMLGKPISFPCTTDAEDRQKIMLSIKAAMGVVRDNYMVLEYQKPAVYPSIMRPETLRHRVIADFLKSQYAALSQTVAASGKFKALCTHEELEKIEEWLNLNQLEKC